MRPKSTDILKVIKNLKKVLPQATRKRHLDMGECMVNKHDYECGTRHCLAGWYAVATCNTKNALDFVDGVNKMVKHLGFPNENEFSKWASTNPQIWGNEDGYGIFSDKDAFYNKEKRPEGAENLQHIIDHWEEVYERIKKLETNSKKNEVA